MTPIESIGGGDLSAYPLSEETQETPDTQAPQVAPQEGCSDPSRIREEEAVVIATSPHLRNIAIQEALNQSLSILDRCDYDWYKDEGLLELIQRLSPSHTSLAEPLAAKISNQKESCIAYLTLAKYQNEADAKESFRSAAKQFVSFNADASFKEIDALFPNGHAELESFYQVAHSRYCLLETLPQFTLPFREHLFLCQLEVKMGLTNAHEAVARLHIDEKGCRSQPRWEPKHLLDLLSLEAQIGSPLMGETLGSARQMAESQGRNFQKELLSIEGRTEAFQAAFEEDLDIALKNESLHSRDYCDLGVSFLPDRIDLAERLLENTEEEDSLDLWLEIARVKIERGCMDKNEALAVLASLIESEDRLNAEDYTSLFLKAAPLFGFEKVQFLIDLAIKDNLPNKKDLFKKEVGTQSQLLKYYLGKALGRDVEMPPSSNALSSPIDFFDKYDALDLAVAITRYTHPMAKPLLERLQVFMEENRLCLNQYKTYALATLNYALAEN